MAPDRILKVAIDAPLMQPFDYLPPPGDQPGPGQRVQVPFRRGTRVGMVVDVADHSELPAARLRRAVRLLDPEPLLDTGLMQLLQWAAGYYQHPPGEVFASALPRLLRRGRESGTGETVWRATGQAAVALDEGALTRAPTQRRVLEALVEAPDGLEADALGSLGGHWRAALRALVDKGLASSRQEDAWTGETALATDAPPTLTADQATADAVIGASAGFRGFLLQGITGSGKTEVYLRCIARALAGGRQSLVLVPEIGLTPQLLERFQHRFPVAGIAVLHSGLTDLQRLEAWNRIRTGRAAIVIGTRSAVFAPLRSPGLIVVDEEHDASFKQQDGFRYSARDIAVWRARQLGVPVILGSATPSLETLANARGGRYEALRLSARPGTAELPTIQLVDLRHHVASDGLTPPLTQAIGRHLEAGGQVLLYLNRRGYAPTLMCPGCGGCVECRRCDARMVLHREARQVRCHHCGAQQVAPERCADCGGDLFAVGQGTQRLEAALTEHFPGHRQVRIDRDSVRGPGGIAALLAEVTSGTARILLGTQMLTKGHDFPDVTLVGIVDADQGLFGTDFRASERLAQTFIQVAGRAGRAERRGEVYLQTHFPEHPLLQKLVREGYDGFAEAALAEREAAGWPPFKHLALLRAEAPAREAPLAFLARARECGESLDAAGIRLLGPAPAPMEKRAGRYRAQLLVETAARSQLQAFLPAWRERISALPEAGRTRWSLDVDPIELF